MSAQRSGPPIAPEDAAAHPGVLGVPWWGAIVIAVGATLVAITFDGLVDGSNLTTMFSAMYFSGCLAAVLAVRRSGLFTAVVQPPLILFVAVPTAYYLFHHATINGLKDILINCGYPLIERFLLMFGTAVVVLLIGIARWTLTPAHATENGEAAEPSGAVAEFGAAAGAKIAALLGAAGVAIAKAVKSIRGDVEDDETVSRPKRATRATAESRRRRSAETATRSRHTRPGADEASEEPRRRRRYADDEPGYEPRRRRPAAGPDGREDYPERRRRAPRESDPRAPRHVVDHDGQQPRRRPPADAPRRAAAEDGRREYRRPAPEGYRPREGYRPAPEGYRPAPDGYRPAEGRRSRSEGSEPGQGRRRAPEGYQGEPRRRPNPYLEGETPRRRPSPQPGENHHPVSRVRYRDDGQDDGADPRPRRSRHSREQ